MTTRRAFLTSAVVFPFAVATMPSAIAEPAIPFLITPEGASKLKELGCGFAAATKPGEGLQGMIVGGRMIFSGCDPDPDQAEDDADTESSEA